MKKAGYIMIIATVMLSIFAYGFLIGRNSNRTDIKIAEPTSKASEPTTASGKVNINTATLDEMTVLPGIGPKLAQRIIDHRETNGPFRTVSELTEVEGIGDKKLLSILDYITI